MKILFLSAEAEPFVKIGGLADVAGALPHALQEIDPQTEVRLALPYHKSIKEQNLPVEPIAAYTIAHRDGVVPVQVYRLIQNDLTIYFISAEPITKADTVYSADPGFDGYKYTLYALASLRLVEILRWSPDIIHANDWHASMAVAYLAKERFPNAFFEHTKTLLTIHNLPYMGHGAQPSMIAFGIGEDVPSKTPLPEWAKGIPLPMAIGAADKINTVSETYAKEMLTPEFGCGLEQVLQNRSADLTGIINGIDMKLWNPRTDAQIAQKFDRFSTEQKEENKKQLLAELGLKYHPDTPLLAIISRLEYQKGIDQAIQALRELDQDFYFIGLGTGSHQIENLMTDYQNQNYEKARALIKYDGKLSRQLYAAADFMLMPSLYEPCGITQMIAMRYGAVPIVSNTGGLGDTVIPYLQHNGTGFLAQRNNPQNFKEQIEKAIQTYHDKSEWLRIQRNGMSADFSWLNAAKKYQDYYQTMLLKE
jgi:starch synthase